MDVDRNCLSYWYPILQKTGLPTPKTAIIQTECELTRLLAGPDELEVKGLDCFLDHLISSMDLVGLPCFLRTGHTSAKHYWFDTCFINSVERDYLMHHITQIVEFSECACICGLPTRTWVVRELLETDPAFRAFNGDMPVNKERRYWIKDREVIGHHPYWPHDAIVKPIPKERWHDNLTAIQKESQGEIELLTRMAKQAAGWFDGAWSIDFLYTKNGWVCIDMAQAKDSFCYFEWPTAPKRQEIGQ